MLIIFYILLLISIMFLNITLSKLLIVDANMIIYVYSYMLPCLI